MESVFSDRIRVYAWGFSPLVEQMDITATERVNVFVKEIQMLKKVIFLIWNMKNSSSYKYSNFSPV